MEPRLAAREDEYKIGWIKRFMEYETMIPGFHDEEVADPEAALKKYGIPLTLEEISFYPPDEDDPYNMRPVFPDSDASLYTRFMKNKIAYRDKIKEDDLPALPAMRKWHKRQQGRCLAVLGARCDMLVHVPFTLELSDGCSVGCPFCGLNAGSLKKVFRYTDENAKLFRDVLTGVKEMIGEAAGQGTMYYATEPLDNPDYESFLADYMDIFGRIPQITTATALRHKELLHKLLSELNEDGRTVYRFSVLSAEDALKIFEEFTPEELVYTELLPQYDDAPACAFANAGRRGEILGEYDDTISCVTGFVVNFARGTVRLCAPTSADSDHPTGEIIFETAEFTNAQECMDAIKGMISRHMANIIAPSDRIRLRHGLKWRTEDDTIKVENGKGTVFTISSGKSEDVYIKMLEMFSQGYHTRQEVVSKLLDKYKGMLVRSDIFFYAINRLWELGILELESGKV